MKHWTIETSEYVLQDKWITVRADSCRTERNINVAPYYVLEYPDWTHIVAFDAHKRVLITRQYRHGARKICTEIPCGIIEKHETPIDAACRELREETGCTVGEMTLIGTFYANPANQTNRIHSFLATQTEVTEHTHFDMTEDITCEFVPINTIYTLIEQGEFNQGLHIASLLLALQKIASC